MVLALRCLVGLILAKLRTERSKAYPISARERKWIAPDPLGIPNRFIHHRTFKQALKASFFPDGFPVRRGRVAARWGTALLRFSTVLGCRTRQGPGIR